MEYKKEIKKLRKSLDIGFLECNYFKKQNKIFFLLIIGFQLMQSMVFNSISDVPQLIMIIGLATFFTVRKKNPVLFGKITYYVVQYI